eukprot:CAMPEP_0184660086 /NCGR_PEP_ID=MMETSP0308-20130426/32461_1 /TAXON_ID=38269 /ORGANISM="Gloeochaete witrockiana, Strain SAG 46.84" /LENGTH=44 /DNA_ID= /DNA_START= /DNA_END= /DNA_ORIENTATION=
MSSSKRCMSSSVSTSFLSSTPSPWSWSSSSSSLLDSISFGASGS